MVTRLSPLLLSRMCKGDSALRPVAESKVLVDITEPVQEARGAAVLVVVEGFSKEKGRLEDIRSVKPHIKKMY